MALIDNLRIVLQGEYAIVGSEDKTTKAILTSTPGICTVFTLYSSEKKICVLAHIDYITCFFHTIVTINNHLKKMNTSLSTGNFKAVIFGSRENDKLSKDIHEFIKETFTFFKISYEIDKTTHDLRKPVKMDTSHGTAVMNELNTSIESLQEKENSEGVYLYPLKQGGLINRFFEIREAQRDQTSLENQTIYTNRTELTKDPVSYLTMLFQTRFSEGKIHKEDWKIIEKHMQERCFELLFRQLAKNSQLLELWKLLLKYRGELNIDILAKGKLSGKSAFDVALENHNHEVVAIFQDIARQSLLQKSPN